MKLKSLLFILVIAFLPALISCDKDDDSIPESELTVVNNSLKKFDILVDSKLVENIDSDESCCVPVECGTHSVQCECSEGAISFEKDLYFVNGTKATLEISQIEDGSVNFKVVVAGEDGEGGN